ncbi:uncharacterized protein LOC126678280 [Mercurialis annua]|uniref:uncharacterized protein LOC126678280 n=1 Tax=Mercurialis annua TaxID=3986 RepID=UPI00215F2B9A|nr:uncharacterized protein LOC126678280 [Mercurialis annua]
MSLWGITKPLSASLNWRNLIKLRDEFKQGMVYNLGKGEISFWHDPWIEGKALVELYPSACISDADIPKNTRVKDVWRRGNWNFPDPFDEVTEGMWNMIAEKHSIQADREDSISWNFIKNRMFTIKSAMNHIRPQFDEVSWWKVMWRTGCVPRHSFIAWLAVKNKLRTRDKLKRWGTIDIDDCMTGSIFKKVLRACLINREVANWRREWSWFSRKTMGKSILAKIRRIAFMCVIYNIWRARNMIIFEKEDITEAMVTAIIRQEVMLKMFSRRSKSLMFYQLYQNWQRVVGNSLQTSASDKLCTIMTTWKQLKWVMGSPVPL